MSKTRRATVIAIVLFAFVAVAGGVYVILRYKTFYSRAGSMEPTIGANQMLVADLFAYRGAQPRRGDVVLMMPPVVSDAPFIKRVVAGPGDRIVIRGGRTFVNGAPVAEPYAPQGTPYDLAVRNYQLWVDGAPLEHDVAMIPPRAKWTAPDTVPRGCYVVLGDNRLNSMDSHAFGFFCPSQPVPNQPNVHPELVGRAIVP